MKSARLAFVILALALAMGACVPPEERAERARAAVATAIASGDRETALAAIGKLREAIGECADAQLELAQLMVRAGNAPEAGWLLEDAARRHPSRADLALALVRVSLLLGNPARAREVADGILPDTGEHAAALALRAQAELQLGDLERALATLAEAEARYPDQPEARLVRIATLLSEDKKEEARTAIEETHPGLGGDGEETLALQRRLDLTLAQIQAEQGETEAALARVDALLAADPTDLLAWQVLVRVLAKEKRAEEALARIEAALGAGASPTGLHVLAAQLYTALGNDGLAEAALRDYVERSKSAAAYQPLVNHHAARSDAEITLGVIDEALERYPAEATLRFQRTEALLAAGRVGEAGQEQRRFRRITFEGDPQVEYLSARLKLAEGDADDAAQRLMNLAPQLDRASTQYWIGRALEETGDLGGAGRRYALAQRRDPTWIAPSFALISLAQRRGDWHGAAVLARALATRAPFELGAWRALVDALARLGHGEAAEAAARQALDRFPDAVEPPLMLAQALSARGETDAALAALDATTERGKTTQISVARIRTLGAGGRIDDGLAEARAAAAAHPDAAEIHAALAALLFGAGAAEEGAAATDRALALAPDDPAPLRERCVFRAATERWLGAREDCTRYLEARPEDAEITFVRALALEQLGETARAVAGYRRAASLDERDPRPHNNLAALLQARGDVDGALAAAQEAYRLDETNPHVMDTLGSLYLEKNLVKRAISFLEEAHARAPDLPDAQLHLGIAYLAAGRFADARPLLAALGNSTAAPPEIRARARQALDAMP